MTVTLCADPGIYPMRLFFSEETVDAVYQDGVRLPNEDWTFDQAAGVLEVRSYWSGRTVLDVEFGTETAVETRSSEPKPSAFTLFPNAPNPFNSSTIIRYDLPETAYVNLSIYTLLGQRIRTLVDVHREAGSHAVTWDGKDEGDADAASGIYLVRMEVRKEGDAVWVERIRKVALMR